MKIGNREMKRRVFHGGAFRRLLAEAQLSELEFRIALYQIGAMRNVPTRQQLNKWINGVNCPGANITVAMADLLGVKMDRLFHTAEANAKP